MSETRKETLRRLFTANNLVQEDVYKHQHYTIITRAGIATLGMLWRWQRKELCQELY